ncbi:MAG: hypothetical protein IJH36_02820, partial [Clostridia bacterium]|nr:hypothetical protein [Clostridia bacterium]
MPVTTTETVKISIPRFYITGDETNAADYGYYILTTQGTNVINYTKSTRQVYANSQGIAVLVVEDFENGTNMKATFQVIDETDRRTEGLIYILEHDPEAVKFKGEERDTQWFFEHSFLTADDYELIDVTDIKTGETYKAPVLKNNIKQLYSVAIPVDTITPDENGNMKGTGSLKITAPYEKDIMKLLDSEGNVLIEADAANPHTTTVTANGLTLTYHSEGSDADYGGTPYYLIEGVEVQDVSLYYAQFDEAGTTNSRKAKVAVIAESKNLDITPYVTAQFNSFDPIPSDILAAMTDPHATARTDNLNRAKAHRDENGNIDYFTYILSSRDTATGNALIGATVYAEGQKASVVSVASIPVNSDHDIEHRHGNYFDAQNVAAVQVEGGEVITNNVTAVKLTVEQTYHTTEAVVVGQDDEGNDITEDRVVEKTEQREYILYLYKDDFVTSVEEITFKDTTNADGRTYTAVKTGANTYQVIVPANVEIGDITTKATYKESGPIEYKNSSVITNIPKTIDTNPAVYTGFALGDESKATVDITIFATAGRTVSVDYTLEIIRVADEDYPYVAVDYNRIYPTVDEKYIAYVPDDADSAVITVSTILEGGQVKIGSEGLTKPTINEVDYAFSADEINAFGIQGYIEVPFTIFPKTGTAQERIVRIYRNSYYPMPEMLNVTYYLPLEDGSVEPVTVPAKFDTVQQQYVAEIPAEYTNEQTIKIEAAGFSFNDGTTDKTSSVLITDENVSPAADSYDISGISTLDTHTVDTVTDYKVTVTDAAGNVINDNYHVFNLAVVKQTTSVEADAKTAQMLRYGAPAAERTEADASESGLVTFEKVVKYDKTSANTADIRVEMDHPYQQIAIAKKAADGTYTYGEYRKLTTKVADGEKPAIIFEKQPLTDDDDTESFRIKVKSGDNVQEYDLILTLGHDDVSLIRVEDMTEPASSRYVIKRMADPAHPDDTTKYDPTKPYQYYVAIKRSDFERDKMMTIESEASDKQAKVSMAVDPVQSDADVAFAGGTSYILSRPIRLQDYVIDTEDPDETRDPLDYLVRIKVTGESGYSEIYRVLIVIQSPDVTLDGDGYLHAFDMTGKTYTDEEFNKEIAKDEYNRKKYYAETDADGNYTYYDLLNVNYNKTESLNETSTENKDTDVYDTADFAGYFVTISEQKYDANGIALPRTAAIGVKTANEYAQVAIGKFLSMEDYIRYIANPANRDVIEAQYIAKLADNNYVSDYTLGENSAQYDLTPVTNDGVTTYANQYNLTTMYTSKVDLNLGVVVPIVIKAENGKTGITYLLVREEKKIEPPKAVWVKQVSTNGTYRWVEAEWDGSKFKAPILNNMNTVDVRVIPSRADVLSVLIGENRQIELGTDGAERVGQPEIDPVTGRRIWISTLKLDDTTDPTSDYKTEYMDNDEGLRVTKNIDEAAGERLRTGIALDTASQSTIVKIYEYFDNGDIISNEHGADSEDYGLDTFEDELDGFTLELYKQSDDIGIQIVTISPGEDYENSDSVTREYNDPVPNPVRADITGKKESSL